MVMIIGVVQQWLSDAAPWPQPKSPTRLKGVISRVALHLVRISYKFLNALTHFDVIGIARGQMTEASLQKRF